MNITIIYINGFCGNLRPPSIRGWLYSNYVAAIELTRSATNAPIQYLTLHVTFLLNLAVNVAHHQNREQIRSAPPRYSSEIIKPDSS